MPFSQSTFSSILHTPRIYIHNIVHSSWNDHIPQQPKTRLTPAGAGSGAAAIFFSVLFSIVNVPWKPQLAWLFLGCVPMYSSLSESQILKGDTIAVRRSPTLHRTYIATGHRLQSTQSVAVAVAVAVHIFQGPCVGVYSDSRTAYHTESSARIRNHRHIKAPALPPQLWISAV
ncbi:hypothetical protein BDV11DRAFT_55523 [Aspergillus similis]